MVKKFKPDCAKCPIQSKCILIKKELSDNYKIEQDYCFFDDLIFDTLSLTMGMEAARRLLDNVNK